MAKFPELVFSGVQPTGNLHLGNYLGALKRFVEMQATHSCLYCVVDMHAMTMPHDPATLRRTTREVTAAFVACGIDPRKNIIFNQSRVGEHAELAWVLDCVARLGWLNRMTQFKEKAGKDREAASIGLYNYPVLMAADILLYRATHVPVGDDQTQHLELTRDIAQKFNNDFAASIAEHGMGEAFFPLPEAADPGTGDAGDEPARRHEEDVEVRSVGIFADRADRRRRDDRAEDPQGQDRRRARCRARSRASPAAPRRKISSASTPRSPIRSKSDVLRRFGGGQFSPFKNALARTRRRPSSRRSAPRSCASTAIPASSMRCWPRARTGRARSPGRTWTRSRTSSA